MSKPLGAATPARSVDPTDFRGPFVTRTSIDRLAVVPASKKLALVEQDARHKPGGESALRRARGELSGPWHFILMDCPPALGLLAINAMAAADSVIVPVEAHGIALEGMADLTDTIAQVREAELNADLELLACRVNRTRQAREVAEFLQTTFPRQALQTRIHENARLGEAFNFRQTILQYAPASSGAVEYRAVADELLARVERLDDVRMLAGSAGAAGGRAEERQHRVPFTPELEQRLIQTMYRMRGFLESRTAPGPRWIGARCRARGFFQKCWE